MGTRDRILKELKSIFDNENVSIGEQLKTLMSCESRYFSLFPDDKSPSDKDSWNGFFQKYWINALKDKNLEIVITDATEDVDGENRKDYTDSTLLHFASRLGAHRSLNYMLDEIERDRNMVPKKKMDLIDKVTHRCTSDCKLDSDVHADKDENKGGTALLVSLTTRSFINYFLTPYGRFVYSLAIFSSLRSLDTSSA